MEGFLLQHYLQLQKNWNKIPFDGVVNWIRKHLHCGILCQDTKEWSPHMEDLQVIRGRAIFCKRKKREKKEESINFKEGEQKKRSQWWPVLVLGQKWEAGGQEGGYFLALNHVTALLIQTITFKRKLTALKRKRQFIL